MKHILVWSEWRLSPDPMCGGQE